MTTTTPAVLFPHQRRTVDDMRDLEHHGYVQYYQNQRVPTSCGVVANAMGSGKTRAVLARVRDVPTLDATAAGGVGVWIHQRMHAWETEATVATRLSWLAGTSRRVSHWFQPQAFGHIRCVPYNLVICTKALALHWETEAAAVPGLPPVQVVRVPRQVALAAQAIAQRTYPPGAVVVVPDTYVDMFLTQVLTECFPLAPGGTPAHGSAASSVAPSHVASPTIGASAALATPPHPLALAGGACVVGVAAATGPVGAPMSSLWQQRCQAVCWSRIVLDDPQLFRLKTNQVLLARFMWMLCATPSDLWPWWTDHKLERCPNVCKDALPSVLIYHASDWVAPRVQRFVYPVRGSFVEAVCTGPWLATQTADQVARLHAGDARAVVPMGPPPAPVSSSSQTSSSAPGPAPVPVHEELLTRLERDLATASPGRRAKLLVQRSGLQERVQQAFAQAECVVCCCGSLPAAVVLRLTGCCQHVLCDTCWTQCQRLQGKCPMCRQPMPAAATGWRIPAPLDDKALPRATATAPAPRTWRRREDIVLELLRVRGRQARILVYSWADVTLGYLQAALEPHGYQVVDVSGTLLHIERKLQAFLDGKAPVLFLNARRNGAGLNLTCATDVVLYHKLAPDMEDQVLGRALRYPRQDPLRVHVLVTPTEDVPTGPDTTHVAECTILSSMWASASV